jgi:signal transduction histidine kinase
MTDCVLTQFAPAERAGASELDRQRRHFCDAWFFGELMHYLPEMVLILNRERQLVYANRAALAGAGARDLDSVVGLRPGEAFGCIHSSETPGGCGTTLFCRYCGAVGAILQSQQGRFAVEECRLTVERGGAEEALDLRVWASPMTVEGETYTFFVMGDIADEKRRNVLERIFLHDLTNTASALNGFLELLELPALDAEMRDDYTRRVATLSSRILDEIEAHRQLLAAEHNELRTDPQSIESRVFLEGILGTYDRPDMLDGRILKIADGAASVTFESDPALLGRVVGNMVKNAIEASAPGETVTMGCRADGGSVSFWVRNRTYMPENIRMQVFGRSFSTKGAGRGLGTYSMKYLTEKYLGGHVVFTSTEAEGTTFMATYPLHHKAEPAKPKT